jgi:hypothetical protein
MENIACWKKITLTPAPKSCQNHVQCRTLLLQRLCTTLAYIRRLALGAGRAGQRQSNANSHTRVAEAAAVRKPADPPAHGLRVAAVGALVLVGTVGARLGAVRHGYGKLPRRRCNVAMR